MGKKNGMFVAFFLSELVREGCVSFLPVFFVIFFNLVLEEYNPFWFLPLFREKCRGRFLKS